MACTIAAAARAAAQLDQDSPGLEGGDRAFAEGADLRVGPVDGLLPYGDPVVAYWTGPWTRVAAGAWAANMVAVWTAEGVGKWMARYRPAASFVGCHGRRDLAQHPKRRIQQAITDRL